MKAAQDLWAIIQQKAGISQPLTFIVDSSLKVGSYVVDGATIRHNSTNDNNGAVMAVAALSKALFRADMVNNSHEGIILRPDIWRHLQFRYEPTMVRNNYVNVSASGWDRTFFHWHHVPTEGSGGANFHRSWFIGMCLKYPQLAPPSGVVTEETKPDITHTDFAKCIYQEWLERGSPDICSLFEIDGNGYWWVLRHNPAPAYLNFYERERYEVNIAQGLHSWITPGGTARASDGIRYPVTDAGNWARAIYPHNNVGGRYNYIGYYFRMYQAVQAYFDRMGQTHVRFNILGYHSYRCIPANITPDLRRFDVYYTSTGANLFTRETMLSDAVEFLAWRKTGAKLIWRPNHAFRNAGQGDLYAEYLNIVKPDGVQAAPFYPGNIQDYYKVFTAYGSQT